MAGGEINRSYITQISGTDAERLLLTPKKAVQFYATDSGQLFQWQTYSGSWITIG